MPGVSSTGSRTPRLIIPLKRSPRPCTTKRLRIKTEEVEHEAKRSPEAHTGQGIGKPSDVFSFRLVESREIVVVDHQELREREVDPEIEVLGRDIVYFGPLSDALLKHTADETWQTVLG
ncbi:hypothetical protein BJ875DRAFT_443556 [Amylocarpus encephaloides]|uniref:Uncharacterized protein n=1 Tax=Amylocarpus encephaloides TaxID=45428 RepID=A0A9P8C3G2_9HELO|nr:hypothetical protein BJ875DRAFT_443556 [Amylocarpus encephaloides]